MDQVQQRIDTLNKEGEKIMFVKLISSKTNIQPAHIMLGSFVLAGAILMLGIAESLVSRLVGVVYPGIKSLYAIETADKKDDKQWFIIKFLIELISSQNQNFGQIQINILLFWLTYWAIYALFLCIEQYACCILSYFPFYYFAKVCFLIWLFNPVTMGSEKIYTRIVAPMFKRYQVKLDDTIRDVRQIIDGIKKGDKSYNIICQQFNIKYRVNNKWQIMKYRVNKFLNHLKSKDQAKILKRRNSKNQELTDK